MEYNRLTRITNKYPQTGNYITTGADKVSLFGLYDETNKIDFKLESFDELVIVPDTKLRTIVAIYEDRNDTTPQYYTSELYHRDLKSSKFTANPYFLNASFNPSYIVNIYLKEVVNSLDSYKEAELKRGLAFSRNNFILFNNSGISGINPSENINNQNTNNDDIVNLDINKQLDLFKNSISKLENEISNVDNRIKRRGFFGARAEIEYDGNIIRSAIPFNRDKQVDDIKTQLSERLDLLKNRKKELEDKKINIGVKKIVTKELKTENIKIDKDIFLSKIKNKSVIAANPKDIIEINGVFVDCILLVKYIDWVLAEADISEIEDGGVIAPEVLVEYEKVKTEVPVENLDSNNNTNDTINKPELNQGTGKFFEYQIIRLSIPASEAASTMTFKTSNGNIETIATANYGFIGTYCIEENSFSGNYNLYQKTQLAPCNNGNSGTSGPGGGGGYRGGGSYDYYDNQNRNIEYIDRQRDFQNIQ
jgi:hypothetical protein